ncbi:CHAT domain-containing protein [Dactylonectria macrodidyma]|uniref:CHAT domain-containing protein n=1 Tax=Dactylonectria macrodidyma TaxID=307937 RepID=A0A9P9DLT7_9HYPO|nr:CHAT domain-containing protein [Dactylonectria macrodidyma]
MTEHKEHDDAIQAAEKALLATQAGYPDHAKRLLQLAASFDARWRKTDVLEDLDSALRQYFKTLDESLDPSEHLSVLEKLAIGHFNRYLRTGYDLDLDTSIGRYQEIIAKMPLAHPDRAERLFDLGAVHRSRFERKGTLSDIDLTIHYHQEAITIAPLDDPTRPTRLFDLGLAHNHRFTVTNVLKDLNAVISLYEESLAATLEDQPEWLARHFHLAAVLGARFERAGNMADINRAISLYQLGLAKPVLPDWDREAQLLHLSTLYSSRYARVGALPDLDVAIQLRQKVLEKTPSDHPSRIFRLISLANSFQTKFKRSTDTEFLDNALQLQHEALQMVSPGDHRERPTIVQDMGIGYYWKYRSLGKFEDLEKSIEFLEDAVENPSIDVPTQALSLHALGCAYYDKFGKTGIKSDIDLALWLCQDSLDKTPEDSTDRGSRLQDLGAAYGGRYRMAGTRSDLDMAIKLYEDALNHSHSSVWDRLADTKFLLSYYAEVVAWEQAYNASCTAMHLFQLLVPRSLENSDKQYMLSLASGIGSDAAAMALNASKDPFEAVRLLELGRGVIAASLSQIREDVSILQQKHPELGEKFVPAQGDSSGRNSASTELDTLINEIRKLPGFETFLDAPTETEIRETARRGPIVVVNVSDYRCDALIIEPSEIRSLLLPRLKAKDIRDRAQNENLGSLETLEWLWGVLASPVLEALGFLKPAGEICPHVWWIPTGPLTRFPIHAAGYHTAQGSDAVIDRVMSTYGSSIKAIRQGQRSSSDLASSRQAQALLISMENTPGTSSLPYTSQEIKVLRNLSESMKLKPIEPERRKQDVIAHLPECKLFHFAGHGYTDKKDPLRSHLLLQDVNRDPLTVANLLEMNLRQYSPFLAYLSACGTGKIDEEKFADESIHLISAYQLAGYRHVIGTLWEVNDALCVEMARYTYEGMRDGEMTDESVCRGLHDATRKLRDRWRESLKTADGKGNDERLPTGSHSVIEVEELAARLSRDVVLCDDDDKGGTRSLLWVPYVHYGV